MNKAYKVIFSIIIFIAATVFIYYKIDCMVGDLERETISYKDYLYSDKKFWHILRVNSSGNIVFRGKVVLSETNGYPLNDYTAYTYSELKTLFVAQGAKPKKGCDPKKPGNGIYGLGCYMYNPDE